LALREPLDRQVSAATILVIDDLPGNRVLLGHILHAAGFANVVAVDSAEAALRVMGIPEPTPETVPVDVVLMDVMMPEVDGIEALRRIKATPAHAQTPVLMVTALSELDTLERAFRAGAADYITKPINETELEVRVGSALAFKLAMDERRNREAELERRGRELLEVTRLLEESNERLRHLSTLDALTGIANRRRIMEFLDREWRRSTRDGSWLSLVMIDVDYFKNFNDARGHQVGDDCLWMVANCLKRCLNRAADMVGRYGGEEFVAVLPETPSDGAIKVGEAMRASIEALEIAHPDSNIAATVTASLGIASCVPHRGLAASKLVSMADQALYRAKRQGRNRIVAVPPVAPAPSAKTSAARDRESAH
jgi:diguanylate cyclase (GGDEF)-like protein